MYLHPIHFPIPSFSPSAPVPHPIKQNLRGKSGREKNKQTFFFLRVKVWASSAFMPSGLTILYQLHQGQLYCVAQVR